MATDFEALDHIEVAIGQLEQSQALMSFLAEWALDEGDQGSEHAKQARQSLDFALTQHWRFVNAVSEAHRRAHRVITDRRDCRTAEVAHA